MLHLLMADAPLTPKLGPRALQKSNEHYYF